MAIRLAVLTIVQLLVICKTAPAATPSCLQCHPSHYETMGGCTGCHKGDDRTARKDIAHLDLVPGRLAGYRIPGDPSVAVGRQWIETSGCRRCHTVGRRGNRLAANLDELSGRHPSSILASITKPVTAMPDFRFDEITAGHLVNAILASALPAKAASRPPPITVRFNDTGKPRETIFEKRCGGCHQVLTRDVGSLGHGIAGPNLSGLLTRFYPATYGTAQRWTDDRVRKWLANPRESRPNARMQPVAVTPKELTELYRCFRTESD